MKGLASGSIDCTRAQRRSLKRLMLLQRTFVTNIIQLDLSHSNTMRARTEALALVHQVSHASGILKKGARVYGGTW